jgi:EAL domain-containing protein (putative c-di-GMP-specific phosphodiesterase class I)
LKIKKQNIRVAVNVSVRQFETDNFVEEVKTLLNESGIKPENLELEITESIVMNDVEGVIDTLHDLKALGVQIAIDDFGTGFSSLSYLQKLPLDRLKVRPGLCDRNGVRSRHFLGRNDHQFG